MEYRPYYNLSLPERIAPFPMWHNAKKMPDNQELIFVANPTDFEIGTIFSYVTALGTVYLELEEMEHKDFHPGSFPKKTPQIFIYSLRCNRLRPNEISLQNCGRNEIKLMN